MRAPRLLLTREGSAERPGDLGTGDQIAVAGPQVDGPQVDGPQVDGPQVDGPLKPAGLPTS